MNPLSATEIGQRYHRFFEELSTEQRTALAHAKRFIECWLSYPRLRESVAEAARAGSGFAEIRAAFALQVDPADFIGQLGINGVQAPPGPAARLWLDYKAVLDETRQDMVAAGETAGANPGFDIWRRRQVARGNATLGQSASQITHPVIAFELSDGCSIGCWFCGISASRFAGNFDHADNAEEWRAVLRETLHFFGPAAQTGFCYWATDPSDNPGYVRFVADFVDILGTAPVTTTAAPLRDIARTREMIAATVAARALPVRFSILTPRQLRQVHDAFSAEEMLHVGLVLQLQGTMLAKSTAGRARATLPRPKVERIDDGSTIACVSGFLVNMPRRSIRLVTPMPPGEAYPDGFAVLGEAIFTDAASYAAALADLAAAHMRPALARHDLVKLRPQASVGRDGDALALSLGVMRCRVTGPHLDVLERALTQADRTVADMAEALRGDPFRMLGLSQSLGALFDGGLLMEPWECCNQPRPVLEPV